ncbi:Ctr9p [Lachancea thermotolerans CBS 6340]|uniref:KLTH0F19734p n=1 Tax=Lachancea thermotolerans (strain ATCC 56472 / CBS 6340 / NRRL Y-8284) TaxID=559295 RepID=C5DJW9_LACTC|nr:KLTH0F19734p [Lachancea thermotolerans CBS 6340]CAR24608.1 KLTH0F19734p [Lachancea thermotolerans CBS 6340]
MDQGAKSAGYPDVSWSAILDIPLKESEEVVSIDLQNDLPEDPNDLKTLLVEENSDKEHWLTIAIAYSNQGMIKECISLVKMALEVFQGPQSASLHTCLTWAYLKLAKEQTGAESEREDSLTQSEHHLKEAITFDPTWVGNMLATIDLYYQRRQYDKALETSEIFVKTIYAEDQRQGRQSKPNVMFLLVRAKLFYQKRNYNVSLRLFQELLVLNPVLQPDPRIGIGMCFWQLKDYKMAIRSWKRSLELNPSNANIKILILLGEFHKAFTDSEDDESFRNNYMNALQQLDGIFATNKQNPVLLVLYETYCYLKGDFSKVIDIHEKKIIPLTPGVSNTVLSESSFWCGRAYYSLREPRRAFQHFQDSLKANEENLLARFGLGQTQIQNKLVEESILTFENLYATHENIQELNYILGLLYSGKCLDAKSRQSIPPNGRAKLLEKAITYMEKYVKLTKAKKNQLVVLKAYTVLSELYHLQNSYKQSLECLSRVVEQLSMAGNKIVPLEIYNNLGCFHFINGDWEEARSCFEKSSKVLDSDSSAPTAITIQFNKTRVSESDDSENAEHGYEAILNAHPDYVHARIRCLYLKFMSTKSAELAPQMDKLLQQHSSDLDVRSFYSWFLKSHATTNANDKSENLETSHNRETLTKYDSHDSYALISLANLYVTIGRETKRSSSAKEQEKSRQSFVKAVQLFQKVLQVDAYNVFAAQGLAIIFAENKRYGPALEILRKVRDSLDNESVHINLGHCLLEMQEYAKAIENYEIALKKFTNEESRPLLLNLLGRAWYSRGIRERSLECFEKSLDYAQQALTAETEKKNSKMVQSVKFNVALLHFQIAETLRRSVPKLRTVDKLEAARAGLETALGLLKELMDQKATIMPIEELDQRVQLGETTMKSALERCIAEQTEYEEKVSEKLALARKLQEENELKEQEQRKKLEEQERVRRAQQTQEFSKLQEEARKLMDERAEFSAAEQERELNPPQSGDEDEDAAAGKKKKRAKRAKKTDDAKQTPKQKKRRTKAVLEDEEDEGEGQGDNKASEGERSNSGSHKTTATYLSNEFIDDSDEGLEGSAHSTPENSDNEDLF